MSVRRLHSQLRIDRPIDEVFAFFERPGNLDRITPPWMGMRMLSVDPEMREGLEIDYAITPLPHVPPVGARGSPPTTRRTPSRTSSFVAPTRAGSTATRSVRTGMGRSWRTT